MTAIQLQLNLWEQLEQAQAQPQATDWQQLCLAFDEAMDLTPVGQRLATAADAIEQMADVLLARATAWAEDWNRKPGDGPVLAEDLFAELVRQSFSLDLSGLVDEPELYIRSASEKAHGDSESVVEYREKSEVLAELESFVDEDVRDAEIELEHDENIGAWAEAIRGWMRSQGLESVAITQLQDELGLSVVKLWLAALLCGLGMEQRGTFYDVEGVTIRVPVFVATRLKPHDKTYSFSESLNLIFESTNEQVQHWCLRSMIERHPQRCLGQTNAKPIFFYDL